MMLFERQEKQQEEKLSFLRHRWQTQDILWRLVNLIQIEPLYLLFFNNKINYIFK